MDTLTLHDTNNLSPPRFRLDDTKSRHVSTIQKKNHLFYSQGERSVSAKDVLSALTSAFFFSKHTYHMQSEQILR